MLSTREAQLAEHITLKSLQLSERANNLLINPLNNKSNIMAFRLLEPLSNIFLDAQVEWLFITGQHVVCE